MQLLITRSEIPHFYRIDQGELNELLPLNFAEHEIGQPTLKINFGLPLEISTIILLYLFDNYLRDHNYEEAAQLMFVCKALCNEIYGSVFGKGAICIQVKTKRICNTMYLLERIHDEYFTSPRLHRYSAFRLVLSAKRSKKFHPWDTFLDFFQVSHYGVVTDEDELVDQFEVGPLNGDTVWLSGRYLKDGSYDCERFKHPVLNLEICDVRDMNPITSRYLTRNQPFRRFMNLIKRSYGPNTAIHVLFNDDSENNPFDVSQTGFYEF